MKVMITASADVVKTVASKELEEQVQKELNVPDPEPEKAKALLDINENA